MLAAARSRRAGLARGHSRTGWLLQARSLHIEGAVNPATHTLSRDPPPAPPQDGTVQGGRGQRARLQTSAA